MRIATYMQPNVPMARWHTILDVKSKDGKVRFQAEVFWNDKTYLMNIYASGQLIGAQHENPDLIILLHEATSFILNHRAYKELQATYTK